MSTNDYRTYVTVAHPERFDLDFKGFYEDVSARTNVVRAKTRHISDLSYGDDPKQKLDVYLPEGEVEHNPVLLHIHGGGFVEGDRCDYGFLAEEFVKKGIIFVLPSYRLCTDGHTMLDAVADTRKAVQWVRNNIAQFGGNPEAIVLSGHSAGAITTANVCADLAWLEEFGIPYSFIKAAVMISGIYNFPLEFNARNDILTSPEVKVAMSAMQHIGRTPTKMILAVGTIETGPKDDYVSSALAFRRALVDKGVDIDLVMLPDLNHLDTARVVGAPNMPVFQLICSLLQSIP